MPNYTLKRQEVPTFKIENSCGTFFSPGQVFLILIPRPHTAKRIDISIKTFGRRFSFRNLFFYGRRFAWRNNERAERNKRMIIFFCFSSQKGSEQRTWERERRFTFTLLLKKAESDVFTAGKRKKVCEKIRGKVFWKSKGKKGRKTRREKPPLPAASWKSKWP